MVAQREAQGARERADEVNTRAGDITVKMVEDRQKHRGMMLFLADCLRRASVSQA